MQLDFQTLSAFVQTNWGWAAGLAASMSALTLLAGLLAKPLKDDIALWLMGTHEERNWSRSFINLFDAVFGVRHLSLTCFLRSALASLIAVALIWLLMGEVGAIGIRLEKELSLGAVLILALAVNVVADYVSLLETRWLLGLMPRIRTWWAQALVLVADLVISATIIWLAILAYVHTPFHDGEIDSFAEILGVFSVFSVLFYSTFLTSVWTWGYILSTWVLRLIKRLALADWLDVEGQPIRILSLLIGAVTFAGALAASVPLSKDAEGLSTADRALCSVFKGEVCVHVAGLTEAEQAKFDLIVLACAGAYSGECVARGISTWKVDPKEASRLWTASCNGGEPGGCSNLGFLKEHGHGVPVDFPGAIALYRKGCDGDYAVACSNLGASYERGLGVEQDFEEAVRLYGVGCRLQDAGGCVALGHMHERGLGTPVDYTKARTLYETTCEEGWARGCSRLGVVYQWGKGVAQDLAKAASLYRLGCDGGHAFGCRNLGYLFEKGMGVGVDFDEAFRLYKLSCDGGYATGCANLGYMHRRGLGTEANLAEAFRLYRLGCDMGSGLGCGNLGFLYESGLGVARDLNEAARLYRLGCDMGEDKACPAAETLENR